MRENKLILGTVQFGLPYGINNSVGQTEQSEVFAILDECRHLGIHQLDTAASYGNSEQLIGQYMSLCPGNFQVNTKLSFTDGYSWKTSMERSLRNLKVSKVNTLMFHSYLDFKSLRSSHELEKLLSLKGKSYNQLGVSVYTNEELEALLHEPLVEVVQVPFNALDNATFRAVHLDTLTSVGKTIHARSVFLQGLFFMDKVRIPRNLRELISPIECVIHIAKKYQIAVGALLLNYVLSKPYINGVLFGVDSVEQFKLNLDWSQQDIDPEAFHEVDAIEVRKPHLLNPSVWKN